MRIHLRPFCGKDYGPRDTRHERRNTSPLLKLAFQFPGVKEVQIKNLNIPYRTVLRGRTDFGGNRDSLYRDPTFSID